MARTRRFVGLGVLAIIGWWAVAGTAQAQVTTADVVGRVTDASGGALPGATVTVTNPATGDTRAQVTGDTGDYTFTLLPIGRYTLTIELTGFGHLQPQRAGVGRRSAPRRCAAVVGTIAETITVTAEAPLVQSDSATVGALLPETRRAGPAAERPQRHRPGADGARARTRACRIRCRAATGPTTGGRPRRCR